MTIASYHRYAIYHLGEQRRLTTLQSTLKALDKGGKQRKLVKGLKVYQNMKVAQACLRELLRYTTYKNKHRLALVRIKAAFKEQPSLARPLLAMRNFLKYKLF